VIAQNPATGSSPDALQQVLDETRQRFIAIFAAQCDSIRVLVDTVAAVGVTGPVAELTQVTHRLSGLAGTIGFPTISARASELEALVDGAGSGSFDAVVARNVVDAIREAFTKDLASLPVWALPAIPRAQGAKILVAEDEPDQRAIVTTCLAGAGYVPIAVVSGDLVVDVARAEKPSLILLDIAMPRLDGYSVCRLLKADPELAGIPVIFMTTRANLDDKLAGLMLGADEFLSKPVDMRELVLRIQLLLKRSHSGHSAPANEPSASRELTRDAFLALANEEIGRSPAALAIVRLPAKHLKEGSRLLSGEIRSRDAIGASGPKHLLILMPEMTAAAARDRLEPVVDRLVAQGLDKIHVGVTASAGTKTAEALIGEAEEALAEARSRGDKTAIWGERPGGPAAAPAARTVVVAEDDPEVARIVEAQVRAAGYKAIVAVDGEQAVAAVREHDPAVLVLDLTMPKLNGFDVLTKLGGGTSRWPLIMVLSARGREHDVMRAFELGADDYMTKPFDPQELTARIAQLLK
jgi:DNA-binding response OmpR family regulator/HPt (histidine-containing phosphotransfer) domain-containing protein